MKKGIPLNIWALQLLALSGSNKMAAVFKMAVEAEVILRTKGNLSISPGFTVLLNTICPVNVFVALVARAQSDTRGNGRL